MWYWILLALFTAIVVVSGLPDATAALAILTFGIWFLVVVIAVNLLPLLLSFLPLKLFPEGQKWIGFLVSVGVYAGYLLGTGVLADRQAVVWVTDIQANDTRPSVEPTKARTFELRFEITGTGRLCREACTSLIAGGEADWVRVRFSNGVSGVFAPDTQSVADCVGLCIREVSDSGEAANITVIEQKLDTSDLPAPPLGGLFLQMSKAMRVEAYSSQAVSDQPIYRQTAVKYQGIDNVLVWLPHFTGTGTNGYEAGFGKMRGDEITVRAALREMGWAKF